MQGISKDQLYSTASYQQKNLEGIDIEGNILAGWDFSGQNLSNVRFGVNIVGADFTGATITGAIYKKGLLPSLALSKAQLYSTASYQQKNLRGLYLGNHDLSGWDFSDQNLANADFTQSTLVGANLSGAVITGASFFRTTSRGFTKEQLYSTTSYQQKDLRAIYLRENDLSGWDFSGQDLTNADFLGATLTGANLSGALITGARLDSTLPGNGGLTKEQLYSTASYQRRDLQRIDFDSSSLLEWNFAGQDLRNARFSSAFLGFADFSLADLRSAEEFTPHATTVIQNAILPDGVVSQFVLDAEDLLVVRDFNVPITVKHGLAIADRAALQLVFDDREWGSTISVLPDPNNELGGTLSLAFAPSVSYEELQGATFDLFDWPEGFLPTTRFDRIDLPAGTQWDLSRLYTTGEATLTAIPEPSTLVLLTLAGIAAAIVALRRRILSRQARVLVAIVATILALSCSTTARADIFRWDNGELIPGTEGITPGPGVLLNGLNLQYADLARLNLTGVNFFNSRLNNARLDESVLLNANFTAASVGSASFRATTSRGFTKEQLYSTGSARFFSGIDLSENDLSGWDLKSATMQSADFENSNLSGANFTDALLYFANLRGANFSNTVISGARLPDTGLTTQQLQATANYQLKNLQGIDLRANDFTAADFTGHNLSGTQLEESVLTRANSSNAEVFGTSFCDTTSRGFTKEHLYSTAGYQHKDLRRIGLCKNDLSGWDFSGQNLQEASVSGANLVGANLANADLTDADIDEALLSRATSHGFTKEQLYSTHSYRQRRLGAVGLADNDLAGWDFSNQSMSGSNLRNSDLSGANLTETTLAYARLDGANLSGALISGASFGGTDVTKEQLESTASYQQKDLRGITFSQVQGWDLSGQDLRNAWLNSLFGANLAGAQISGTRFGRDSLTKEQLYSTASYQQKNLQGIRMVEYQLAGFNFTGQDLTSADLSSATLTGATFSGANLSGAKLSHATLFNADLHGVNFTGALFQAAKAAGSNLSGANLTNANLDSADFQAANLSGANLTGADFIGTKLTGANLRDSVINQASFTGTVQGFTKEQLYSTANHQQKNLRGIVLDGLNLTGWDFSAQNLTDAQVTSTVTNANFTDAIVAGASFRSTTGLGFVKEQLYSTASYKQKNLQRIDLRSNNLTGWGLQDQNLAGANFEGATLTNANFSGAIIDGATFRDTRSTFSKEQLYSTATYRDNRLQGLNLSANDLTGWDFSGRDLTNVNFLNSTLANANFTGAIVNGTNFGGTATRGFTNEQLYSTASYQQKDLRGIKLSSAFFYIDLRDQDLTGAVFTNANLSGSNFTDAIIASATFSGTSLHGFTPERLYSTASYKQRNLRGVNFSNNQFVGWNFSGQDLTGANFDATNLRNADLTGAIVRGVNFPNLDIAFFKEQLYSTASYQQKDLREIELIMSGSGFILPGWNFNGQDLRRSRLSGGGADFSLADLRQASVSFNPATVLRNTILPDGKVNNLDLVAGEKLIAFPDDPLPVTLAGGFAIAPDATFDLTNNAAIVQSSAATKAADLTRLNLLVKQGYRDGDWNGAGVTSSTAAAEANRATGVAVVDNALALYTSYAGQAVDADSILLKYTYYGDFDLNGAVDGEDLTVFAINFGRTSGASQVDGDIDFNGTVDGEDLTTFAINFGKGIGNPLSAGSVQAVPEPATIALALPGALMLLSARRVRRRT